MDSTEDSVFLHGNSVTARTDDTVLNISQNEPEVNKSAEISASGNSQTTEVWFSAIRQNDLEKVKHLLSCGCDDVSRIDEIGWSGLHYAAWNGFLAMTEVLLSSGAKVDVPGPGGVTALALASQQGHVSIVEALLRGGSDVRATADIDDSHGVTALHLATQRGHSGVVRSLLRAGAAVNASMTVRGVRGLTALHLAVENELLDLIDVLIETGSDVNRSTQSTDQL